MYLAWKSYMHFKKKNKHTYSWKARLLMNKQAHIEMSTVISVEGSWELEW